MTAWFKPPVVKPAWVAVAVALMLGTVAASEWAKPTRHWADAIGMPHYADIAPMAFGDWQAGERVSRTLVSPVQEQNLLRLYTETMARTYIHKPTGRVLMLSIAYGRDQSTDTQLHTPEQCYPSQGFLVERKEPHDIATPYGTIPAVRMFTSLGPQRSEPLTFFIRVGDGLVRGSKERNLARLNMALRGYLVDGMLFRVSEINRADHAIDLQDTFIRDFLASLTPPDRQRLIGSDTRAP